MTKNAKYVKAKIQLNAVKLLTKVIQIPRPFVFIGAHSALKLCNTIEQFGAKRILIVTDQILVDLGVIQPIETELKKLGLNVSLYAEVKPDPTFQIVESGVTMAKKNSCDSILAVGGGSAIDTAKVIALSSSNNKSPKKLLGIMKARVAALPLFVIPTTSGTGSEVTVGAVLSDNETHQKGLVIDAKLMPIATALDPMITKGMPNFITADTGLDALTHAIEAWVSTFATKESDYYAKAATKLIFDNLEKAYHDGTNLEAREAMALASHYAGIALNSTNVGYIHAFAHQLGAHYRIPHGRANAIVMPHVLAFGKDVIEKDLADMAKYVGLAQHDASQTVAANALLDKISDLLHVFNIHPQLKELKTDDFDMIIKAAFKEAHGMYSVPKYMQYEDAANILKAIHTA